MKTCRLLAIALAIAPSLVAAAPTIQGCPVFPANNVWNARVDNLPVHPLSAQWVANVRSAGDGATRPFHMDFGSGLYPDPPDVNAAPIGIPYVVVSGTQPKVTVAFDYAAESDVGPYPIPPNAPIEGVGASNPNVTGDRHVLVIDKDNCILYETYDSRPVNGGASWTAGSGAIYNLNVNGPLRPSTWTSADAAGLPIFPGLARYEEVAAGAIEHALRFTASQTQRAFIWPARHQAGSTNSTNVAPMGARFRLKASYNINGFSPQARAIAQAMKTYGMILADNGSPWFVSGIPNPGWNNDQLHELDVLRGGDFEAVDTSSLMVNVDSGQANIPVQALAVTRAGANASSGTVTSSPAAISCGATCSANVTTGSSVTLTATQPAGTAFAGWSGDCSGTAPCVLVMGRARNVVAHFVPAEQRLVVVPPGPIDLGGQSMGTVSPSLTFTVTNVGTANNVLAVVSLGGASAIKITHACNQLNAGQSCPVQVRLEPPVVAGALNSTVPYQATLGVQDNMGGPATSIALSGSGEKSLVSHYYRAILERAPDGTGHAFWHAEATRLAGQGANPNEIWFVMANYFFNSPEYIGLAKSDGQFLTDVYNTFFNRPPDGGGLSFWQSQLNAGISREGVIFWFMFSTEFRTFAEGIFGNTAARPEVDMVMDLFRGILNRFPETSALSAFVGSLRQAQCQPQAQRAGAVYQAVNDISYFFLSGGAEYTARNRSNVQYVSDMYNAFLRRGGSDGEMDFWINQLNTGAKNRNQLRADFIDSSEFAARVNAVINAGCVS